MTKCADITVGAPGVVGTNSSCVEGPMTGVDLANSALIEYPVALEMDGSSLLSLYPSSQNNEYLDNLTIGTLINSTSILDVLKKNHEIKIGSLPAEKIFKAIKEHAAGNERNAGPLHADAMLNDCDLAGLTTRGFSFALTDATGFLLHLYQGGKVFNRQANGDLTMANGDLTMGGLVYCDPKKEHCPKENEKKKLLIEIVKDISINHFFDKIKNIVQYVYSSKVTSDKGFDHRVFDAITSKKMLVSQMKLTNGTGIEFGSLVAYAEFE